MKERNRVSKATQGSFRSKKRNDSPGTPAGTQAVQSSLAPFRQYRFLSVVLALSVPLGVYEALQTDLPASNAEVRREWFFDTRFDLASELLELYPSRSQGHFLQSYQAGMCYDIDFQNEVCRRFKHQDLRDVKEALEQAVSAGATDQEQMLHFYAFILVKLNESPEKIEAAIKRWRKNFPNSTKPDPRQMQ